MILLRELLTSTATLDTLHPKDITVSGISYHSQKCKPGDLFVAINGYQTNGHKYLGNAVENGAVAAVVEEFNFDLDIPQIRVANSRIALAQLGAAFYGNPADKMKMIGITATNGKTTTSYMTNAILENHGLKTGLIGTVVIKVDDVSIPSELTTPESLDLQHYLKQMVDKGVSHVSMEVSSAALETRRVEGVDYDIVTFNNLSREHIDSHGTFEQYFEAKSSLITNAGEHSYAVLNLDDSYSASLADKTKASVVTFGVKSKEGHIYCKNLDLSTGRARYTYEIVKPFQVDGTWHTAGEFDIQLAVPGLHSVYNSMVAITVALLCGIPVETIQATMRTFAGVERRFEFIYENDFMIIDDHFANPGNIHVTLETVKFMDYDKLHLVYAIRGSRGPTVNRENAETIVQWMKRLELDEIIATRSISHVTSKDFVTDEETQVFLDVMEQASIRVRLYDELPDAIAEGLSHAASRDLVLLAGCQGMDPGAQIALKQLEDRSAAN
ncbi:Mur ligase family protein [Paenibacillus sp. MCAF20]